VEVYERYSTVLTPSENDILGHMGLMHRLAARAVVVVELGTRHGHSTAALLAGVTLSGGHVWSVDISKQRVPEEFEGPYWTFIQGDSIEMAREVPDQIDLLLIDTVHSYPHTLRELKTYLPKMAKGGIILLHDTENKYPVDDREIPYPVMRAMQDFCAEYRLKYDHVSGSWGMGIVYV